MSETDLHELEARLEELENEERLVSARRRKMHDRIAMFPDPSGLLESQERELSTRRRELHKQIDELRERRHSLRAAQPDLPQ